MKQYATIRKLPNKTWRLELWDYSSQQQLISVLETGSKRHAKSQLKTWGFRSTIYWDKIHEIYSTTIFNRHT